MEDVSEGRKACLCTQDTLTRQPSATDELLYALPVCAPYTVLAGYTYKLKLTPGSQKKGKAARQAIGLLSGAAGGREKELMRAVTDDELVRVMIGNVKVQAQAKLLQAQKAQEKKERKAAATENRKRMQGGGGQDEEDADADGGGGGGGDVAPVAAAS